MVRRFRWIDGVVPKSVVLISPNAIQIFGGAIVVLNKEWTVRPVHTELSTETLSRIRLAGDGDSVPYSAGRVALVDEPASWEHDLELDLRS